MVHVAKIKFSVETSLFNKMALCFMIVIFIALTVTDCYSKLTVTIEIFVLYEGIAICIVEKIVVAL